MTYEKSTSSMGDREIVAQLWRNESCPYFDLIMCEDGQVFPIEFSQTVASNSAVALQTAWIRISDITDLGEPNHMNEGFAVLCRRDFPDEDLSITGGECFPSGRNGFVAVTSLTSGRLRWLAFFTDSNPFDSVNLEGNEIIATSTSDKKFVFPLKHPEQVKMSCP